MMSINRNHAYFWLLYYTFLITLDFIRYKENFSIVRDLYMMFMQISIFYTFLFVLFRFSIKSFWHTARSIGFFLLSFSFILLLNYYRGKVSAYYGQPLHETFEELLLNTVSYYNVLAFYALGYYYLTRSNRKEKKLRLLSEEKAVQDVAAAQLVAQNAQMKQSILELENNFLRAQINPHFLYNTLNVFYAQAQPFSEPLGNSILTLAKIMRYSLETTQGGHLVPLEMEVAHLRRVISIHQLRFDNQLQINFTVEEPLGEVKVVPLIFITLLENALKHGETSDPDSPIALWLAADTSRIYFTIRNKIGNQPRDQSLGIGMENIKKRLQAVYGDRHQFGIEEKDGHYHVVLAIEHSNNGELNVKAT